MKKLMLLLFPVFLIAVLSFIFTTPIPAKLKSFIGLSDSRATEKSSMSNDVAKNVNVDERVKKEVGVCKSFEKDRASYYLDEKNVYVEDKVLDGADPKTFIFLANYEHDIGSISYAKDKSNVYFNCGEVYDSKGNKGDSPTFVYLGEGYAKDKNMVWFETRPLDETSKEKVNVDVASFAVDKKGFAHDKNYTWEYGYVVPKGKHNAWLNGELVK